MRTLHLIAVFMLLQTGVRASEFKSLTTRQGLSNNRVFNIAKDTEGLMWFATRTGIDRYDGTNFKHFRLVNPQNEVHNLGRSNFVVIAPNKTLWAGNSNGNIFVYQPEQERFEQRFRLSDQMGADTQILNRITFVTDDFLLLYGSFGLRMWEMNNSKSDSIMGGSHVTDVVCVGRNRYAVASGLGLHLVDLSNRKSPIVSHLGKEVIQERIQTIRFDQTNQVLYAGSYSGILYKCYLSSNRFFPIFNVQSRIPIRNILIKGGQLFLSTDGLGVFVLDENGYRMNDHYQSSGNGNSGLSSDIIYDLFTDEDNSLWLATYQQGISILQNRKSQFHYLSQDKEFAKLMGNVSISAILEDREGNMWFGTDNGIAIHDKRNGRWRSLLHTVNNHFIRYRIVSFMLDQQGYIWAGSFTHGLLRINPKNLTVDSSYNSLFSNLPSDTPNRFYATLQDSNGDIWLGGFMKQLFRFNPKTREVKSFQTRYINCMAEYKGEIYIGTTVGLMKFDRLTGNIHPFPKSDDPIYSIHINSLYIEEDNIWVATDQGLASYNFSEAKSKVWNSNSGLISDFTFAVVKDDRKRIWVSSDRGLSCINTGTGEVNNYQTGDELKIGGFNLRSVCMNQTGDLYFGAYQGALSFDPLKIEKEPIRAKLYLADLKLNYASVYDEGSEWAEKKNINGLKKLRFSYKENTFSLNFAAINYTDISKIVYSWRLKGYDNQWLQTNRPLEANYSNVPPGHYTFEVQAIDKENKKVLDKRSIAIIITPHPLLSFWAILIYLMGGGYLLYYLYRTINDRLHARRMSQMMHYFSDTAHEIKTPISLIMGPLTEISEHGNLHSDDRTMLDLAMLNAKKLLVLVNKLLDFQRFEAGSGKLLVARYDVVDFMQNQLNNFQQVAIQKQIVLIMEVSINDRTVWFDASKMETVIGNLLSNAVKYTPSGGKVTLRLSQEGNKRWTVEVEDTGIGIAKDAAHHLFKRFYRATNAINSRESGSGIGLMLCRSLVGLLKGTLTWQSKLGEGTCFKLSFLYGKEHFEGDLSTQIVEKESKETPPLALSSDYDFTDSLSEDKENKLKTILIVEDNDQLRQFIKYCLRGKYYTLEAADGEEALAIIEQTTPDLILSDIMMPRMNGYQLCSHIKGEMATSHIPVILLTALSDKSQIVMGYDNGADNYVTKPFDTTILMMKIDNCLKIREELRRNVMRSVEEDHELVIDNELDQRFINSVRELLNKNLSNGDYSINELCRDVAMSRSSFYNKLKALTDQSPNEFIRIFRLSAAAKMLRQGNLNINEVAFSAGFNDAKYFSTIFKKQYGISPSRYGGEEQKEGTSNHIFGQIN